MKVNDKIYCTNVGVYSNQLTKRKCYSIGEINSQNVRIYNDENRLRWYSKFYFSSEIDPEIVSIHLDDNIKNAESDAVEVTFTFSNQDKYWVAFTTPKYLDQLLEAQPYLSIDSIIIVKNLNDGIIKSTIYKLDAQNELTGNCKKY
ncbi:MAG: hypothetical protein MUW56_12145 [Chryseobacterium sp.]|uniref:hypothetical protein n=1 Tax=Chryseobacterium sp. TaxID=1871047 RepID=UPI0025BB0F8A|nr:hypothetical protein [Chryseobacterium sp.]MCJ7934358.1 hypothetical protein [Chryseobacterium sp.]